MKYHGVYSIHGKEVNGSINYYFNRNGVECKLLTYKREDK